MIAGIADTHTLIWYIYNDPRLSANAHAFLQTAQRQGNQVGLSAISMIEIVYLVEKGRIRPETLVRLLAELDIPTPVLREIPVDRNIANALPVINRADVPDMPDRIITATAIYFGVPLLSRDGRIRTSGIATIW
jgi:PIN domain nuclease of toxin-antitoxin system